MTSSIVTASVLSSPRTAIARLSPTSSRSTPQLSKIRANGKAYAVSIVIGWRAAFMRARSGTRTFSCVIFLTCSKKTSGLPRTGNPASEQARILRALESLGVPVQTSDPGASRRQKCHHLHIGGTNHLAGKTLDGLFQLYRESGGVRKGEPSEQVDA